MSAPVLDVRIVELVEDRQIYVQTSKGLFSISSEQVKLLFQDWHGEPEVLSEVMTHEGREYALRFSRSQMENIFYQQLFPVLRQGEWEESGFPSFGNVHWWLELRPIEFTSTHSEEIKALDMGKIAATVRVGLIRYPQHAKLFVQIKTLGYPERVFAEDLALDPENTKTLQMLTEALAVAHKLLKEKAPQVYAERINFDREINQAKNS